MALQLRDCAATSTHIEAYYKDFFSRPFPYPPLPRPCTACRNTEAQFKAQAKRITSLAADKKEANEKITELRAELAQVKRARNRRARDVDALQMDKRVRIYEAKYLREGWIAAQAFITNKQLKTEYEDWHKKLLEIPEKGFVARRRKDADRDDADYADGPNVRKRPRNTLKQLLDESE